MPLQWMIRLAAMGVVFGAISAIYTVGYNAGQNGTQTAWAAEKLATLQQVTRLAASYRAIEQGLSNELSKVQDMLAATTAANVAELDSTLTDLRSDNLRLRERFRACDNRVPENATAASGDDGSGGGGFSTADQEFLIRIAGEADALASRLSACQGYVLAVSAPAPR